MHTGARTHEKPRSYNIGTAFGHHASHQRSSTPVMFTPRTSRPSRQPRYLKQRDQFSCGPIAIINAAKWAGRHLTYADLRAISTACGCVSPTGTRQRGIDGVLRTLCRVTYCCNPTKDRLDKHLKAGGAAVVNFGIDRGDEWDGHYVFVPERLGMCYVVVNDGTTTKCYTNRTFLTRCWRRYKGRPLRVWLLSRLA